MDYRYTSASFKAPLTGVTIGYHPAVRQISPCREACARQGERDGGYRGLACTPGPLLTHLYTLYMAYSECLPTRVNPVAAERACFWKAGAAVIGQVYGMIAGGGRGDTLLDLFRHEALLACVAGLIARRASGVPQEPFAPRRGPLRPSPYTESAIGNAHALVPGPWAPL
jgi:hypothetical protein